MSATSNTAERSLDDRGGPTAELAALPAPEPAELIERIQALAQVDDVIARSLEACMTGVFRHPDGRMDPLLDVRLKPVQLGLLSWLAESCPTPMSVEFGFGMGSSTSVILASRRRCHGAFRHIAFDAFGLGDRGEVVLDFLRGEFGAQFERRYLSSEIGGPALVVEAGAGACGLIFIDGCHRFENVLTDFVIADHLCCLGGYVAFDDVLAPAVECAINYIARNRPDYAIYSFEAQNMMVLRKVTRDKRQWSDFQPFETPTRSNWDLKELRAS